MDVHARSSIAHYTLLQPGAQQAVHEPGGWDLLQQIEVNAEFVAVVTLSGSSQVTSLILRPTLQYPLLPKLLAICRPQT